MEFYPPWQALWKKSEGCRLKNKKAAAFGTYGWSEKSVKMLSELLTEAGFEVVNDGYKVAWSPDEDAVAGAIEFGKNFAKL